MKAIEEGVFKAASWAAMTAVVFAVLTVAGAAPPEATWFSVLLFSIQGGVTYLIGCLLVAIRRRRAPV